MVDKQLLKASVWISATFWVPIRGTLGFCSIVQLELEESKSSDSAAVIELAARSLPAPWTFNIFPQNESGDFLRQEYCFRENIGKTCKTLNRQLLS